MPDDMPQDPISQLAQGAAALHEVYLEYVAAGFSEEQAFKLVLTILAEGIRAAGSGQ